MRARISGASAIAAALLVLSPAAASAQDRTARELVELIAAGSPRARAIHAAVDAARREQEARRTVPNPTASYTRESAGFTEFLQLEQTLPAFGLRSALQRAGVAAVEAAEAERDAALLALRSEALIAIARLTLESERVRESERAVREIQALVDVLAIREREGEGSKYDRLRAEQELHDARLTLAAAAIAVIEARAGLQTLLPPDVQVGDVHGELPQAPDALAVDALVQRALTQRSDLRALGRAVERFRRESDAARQARGIAPSFLAGLKRADDRDERQTGFIAGAGITVPLFDRGNRESARWDAEAARASAEHAAAAARVRAEVSGAATVLEARRQSLQAFSAAAASGEDIRQIADAAYRDGAITILELLDAYRTAMRTRARLIDLRLDAALAAATLQRVIGDSSWQ
jgi:outer membrane protein TolC